MFEDRHDAGRRLAAKLVGLALPAPVVLALPRGGVPVAGEIATALSAPLDLVMVRKIGTPTQPELAAAAVVGGAVEQLELNEDVIRAYGISEDYIARERNRELAELERRRALYLVDRPPVSLTGRTAIVVDDGIATGTSMRAALRAVRRANPQMLVAAAPVAHPEIVLLLREEADLVVTLIESAALPSVGAFYRDFHQLEDDEVIDALADAEERQGRSKASAR